MKENNRIRRTGLLEQRQQSKIQYLKGGGVTGLDRPPNSVKTPTGSSTKLLHNESSTKGGVQQVSGSRIFLLHLCKFCIPEDKT